MATTVSAVIRRGGSVLLVSQGGHGWFLPGGVVEPGEPLFDAVRREVREETGLVVKDPIGLAYVTYVVVRLSPDEIDSGQAFVFEVADPAGEPRPEDPDGDVSHAEFVPLDEAIARVAAIPWPRMAEPAAAYLSGTAPSGTVWQWAYGGGDEERLLGRIPEP